MKFFKKFAISCLALMMCFGMASLVACGDKGGDNGSSSSSDIVSSEESSSQEVSSEEESSEVVNSEEVSSETVNSEEISNSEIVSSEVVSSEEISSEVVSSEVVSSEEISAEEESSENSEGTSIEPQANAYNFLVLKADGSPAVGYKVQMCTTDGSGMCYMFVDVDANGFVAITVDRDVCPAPGVYEVHVLGYDELLETFSPVELAEVVYTPESFSMELITIRLA